MKTKSMIIMAAAAAVLISCSDWTKPESIQIEVSSLEKDNPELYAEYCGMIRAYKASEHKITYVAIDTPEKLTDQSSSLTSLPDSVDFVELSNPENAGRFVPQMEKLRSDKGFRFVAAFSYDKVKAERQAEIDRLDAEYEAACEKIKADYEAAKAAAEEKGEDPAAVPEPVYPDAPAYPEIDGYFADELARVFGYVDALGLDAVRVQYAELKDTYHLTEEELAAYNTQLSGFFGPVLKELETRKGVGMLLETKAEYVPASYVSKAEYVILPCQDLTGTEDMDYLGVRTKEIHPDAKLLYSVTNTSSTDKEKGVFNAGEQIPLVSQWMGVSSEFRKDGIVIYDIRSAFYGADRNTYSKLRNVIRIMNPNS